MTNCMSDYDQISLLTKLLAILVLVYFAISNTCIPTFSIGRIPAGFRGDW